MCWQEQKREEWQGGGACKELGAVRNSWQNNNVEGLGLG